MKHSNWIRTKQNGNLKDNEKLIAMVLVWFQKQLHRTETVLLFKSKLKNCIKYDLERESHCNVVDIKFDYNAKYS